MRINLFIDFACYKFGTIALIWRPPGHLAFIVAEATPVKGDTSEAPFLKGTIKKLGQLPSYLREIPMLKK